MIGLGTGNVDPAKASLNHSRNEIENVAVVVSRGIGDIDYVEAAEFLLRRDLCGIDGGRRLHHVDDFANFLNVEERDFKFCASSNSKGWQIEGIEAFFFDPQSIGAGRKSQEVTAS